MKKRPACERTSPLERRRSVGVSCGESVRELGHREACSYDSTSLLAFSPSSQTRALTCFVCLRGRVCVTSSTCAQVHTLRAELARYQQDLRSRVVDLEDKARLISNAQHYTASSSHVVGSYRMGSDASSRPVSRGAPSSDSEHTSTAARQVMLSLIHSFIH
jgi:hypothetical protein